MKQKLVWEVKQECTCSQYCANGMGLLVLISQLRVLKRLQCCCKGCYGLSISFCDLVETEELEQLWFELLMAPDFIYFRLTIMRASSSLSFFLAHPSTRKVFSKLKKLEFIFDFELESSDTLDCVTMFCKSLEHLKELTLSFTCLHSSRGALSKILTCLRDPSYSIHRVSLNDSCACPLAQSIYNDSKTIEAMLCVIKSDNKLRELLWNGIHFSELCLESCYDAIYKRQVKHLHVLGGFVSTPKTIQMILDLNT